MDYVNYDRVRNNNGSPFSSYSKVSCETTSDDSSFMDESSRKLEIVIEMITNIEVLEREKTECMNLYESG